MRDGGLEVDDRLDRECVGTRVQGNVFEGGVSKNQIAALDVENKCANIEGQY